MLKICKTLFASIALSFLFDQIIANEHVEEAPSYDEIVPEIGWNRYSGDSARSIKGWFRWWKYLRMKESESFVMKWIGGLKIRIHPKNEVYRALFVRGIYEPNLVVAINAMLPKGGVFIEAGANQGYVSLLASKAVGKEGRVFAVEPSGRDFARLSDNVNMNGLDDVVFPRQLAFSDNNGEAKLLIADEERSSLNTLGNEISFKGVEKIKTEEVDALTIDTFVEREKITRIDLLKLDVEGSELKTLNGARNVVEKYRPAIMLGVNRAALKSCGADYSELQNIIDEMNYYVYKIVEKPTFALERIKNISDAGSNVVVCLHESVLPPILPQPKERFISDIVSDFFLR